MGSFVGLCGILEDVLRRCRIVCLSLQSTMIRRSWDRPDGSLGLLSGEPLRILVNSGQYVYTGPRVFGSEHGRSALIDLSVLASRLRFDRQFSTGNCCLVRWYWGPAARHDARCWSLSLGRNPSRLSDQSQKSTNSPACAVSR